VGGSNNTTTPRLNTDDTVRDAQESTVQDTSTARVSDTKRKLPVANYDYMNVSSHPVSRPGKGAKDLSNSEKLLAAIVDDQGGATTPSKQEKSENLKAAAAASTEKSIITSESSICDPIDHLDRSIGTNAERFNQKFRGDILAPAEQDSIKSRALQETSHYRAQTRFQAHLGP
jgi:hypothetical protein